MKILTLLNELRGYQIVEAGEDGWVEWALFKKRPDFVLTEDACKSFVLAHRFIRSGGQSLTMDPDNGTLELFRKEPNSARQSAPDVQFGVRLGQIPSMLRMGKQAWLCLSKKAVKARSCSRCEAPAGKQCYGGTTDIERLGLEEEL